MKKKYLLTGIAAILVIAMVATGMALVSNSSTTTAANCICGDKCQCGDDCKCSSECASACAMGSSCTAKTGNQGTSLACTCGDCKCSPCSCK